MNLVIGFGLGQAKQHYLYISYILGKRARNKGSYLVRFTLMSVKKKKNALKINFRQECFERGEQVSGIQFTYFETALTGLEAETNKCWAF